LPLDGPTEVRDLTAHFNAMTAEIANARREEADLLANLRHDLRTPVTVISGFAAALTDGTATGDDIPRAARAIGEEAARLEDLVGQLGAFERLDSADPGLRPEPLNAADVVAQTAERFRTSAAAAGVDVVATVADPTLTLTADRSAVDRILGNLVGNAIAALEGPTFATGGRRHVWIAARPVPATPAGDAVALEVTDDGPGFPPGAVGRVFERFYRADPSRARAAPETPVNPGVGDSSASSGLGLAIVRDLARAHGGEAFAENVAPHGARVSVVLPLIPRVAGRS
jgi:signal transduction histidine kinase